MAERKKQNKNNPHKKGNGKSPSPKQKTEKNSKAEKPQENNNIESPFSYLWWTVIFAAIGIIICLAIIVGLIPGDESGEPLLGYLSAPILGLFGVCSPVIGLYFILYAYFCYKNKYKSLARKANVILLIINIVFLLGIVHIIMKWDSLTFSAPSLELLWNEGVSWIGNGVIGGYIGFLLSLLLHKSVGLIVGTLIYITSLIFFFGSSPIRLFKVLRHKTKLFFKYIHSKSKSAPETATDSLTSEANKSQPNQVQKQKLDKNTEYVNTSSSKPVIPSNTSESNNVTSDMNQTPKTSPVNPHLSPADLTKKTENYVTGSIYDAPLTAKANSEIKSKSSDSNNNDNVVDYNNQSSEIGKEATKNKFGFMYGREAKDEFPSDSEPESSNFESNSSQDANEINDNSDTTSTDSSSKNENIPSDDENTPFETSEKGFIPEEPEFPPYIFPPVDLLEKGVEEATLNTYEVERKKNILLATLSAFKVKADVVNISCGPTITRYELEPEMGVSVKSIEKLGKDLALRLEAKSLRIEAPIPGKCAVGIEVSNSDRMTVKLRDILDSPVFRDNKSKLFCCLGVDVAGNAVYLDIPKMPHLLIAGATGMGKSVCLNSLIVSLLYRATPEEVKLILIDPKKVEFSHYADIPHLLAPVVTNINKCAGTLNWAVSEMERRYDIFEELGLRNLEEYNSHTAQTPEAEKLPSIVIVIDELADLMMQAGAEVENSICRLAQKARAAGMYLILGTQRPSVDVITGLIKANIPSRIALAVTSQVDSRTILDHAGAENLLDKGDILFAPAGARKELRVQGAFISTKELFSICEFVRKNSIARYDEKVVARINEEAENCGKGKKGKTTNDSNEKSSTDTKDLELMIAALEVGFEQGTISTSYIQRRLSFGYAKAARVVDLLQQNGFVTAPDSVTKLRKINISPQEFAELKLNAAGNNNEGEQE